MRVKEPIEFSTTPPAPRRPCSNFHSPHSPTHPPPPFKYYCIYKSIKCVLILSFKSVIGDAGYIQRRLQLQLVDIIAVFA